MSSNNFSFTAPVNPPGAEPVLTRSQVWAGLQRKVRHADEFVPMILTCEVVSEEANVVTRVITIENGQSPIREVCTEYEPCRVEFVLEDGSKVHHLLGVGMSPDNTAIDEELYLTYAFEWKVPQGVTKGTPQWNEMVAKHTKMSTGSLLNSLKVLRNMAKDGRI
ncbi:hypothetical protein EMPS_01618 [Entomortierella parvispora]|uniref:DUF1857-domain-containing protein n=1 Tax=Entomortierella parvispora TaxID=205924 RepID=A0A9P3H3W9_9FUNG|nr:hypothetical protein EMPS_01618 [Entomortierella parvispora]